MPGGPTLPSISTCSSAANAVSGTARHERRRVGNYGPAREIAHLNTVLDLFEERFRDPDRVIQYGCSGGGYVALAVAEQFADRVDGTVALGAYSPVWFMNTMLDGWFVRHAQRTPTPSCWGRP